MRLFEAQVISNFDYTETGRIQVSSTSFAGNKSVKYTSPYGGQYDPYTGEKSGFFAIPPKGSLVLIAQTEDEEDFYLISTIHQPDKRVTTLTPEKSKKTRPIPVALYELTPGFPQQIILSDRTGNQLTLSHGAAREMNVENVRAELKSGQGKKLSLIDSPLSNRIILETEEHDGMVITARQPEVPSDLPDRHLLLRSGGMIQEIAQHGIDLLVADGLQFDIINESTGVFATSGIQFGNVNIKSKHKDINITTKGGAGRVLIRAEGTDGVVQINSDGSIIIKAPNDNIFIEANNINMKAASDLNIEAGNNINIKAGNQAIMSGSQATLNLTNDAALDGAFVHLAPAGGVGPANGAESSNNITNDYGE